LRLRVNHDSFIPFVVSATSLKNKADRATLVVALATPASSLQKSYVHPL